MWEYCSPKQIFNLPWSQARRHSPPGLLRQAQGVREFGEDQRRDCQGHQNGPNKEGTPGHIVQLSLGIIGVRVSYSIRFDTSIRKLRSKTEQESIVKFWAMLNCSYESSHANFKPFWGSLDDIMPQGFLQSVPTIPIFPKLPVSHVSQAKVLVVQSQKEGRPKTQARLGFYLA